MHAQLLIGKKSISQYTLYLRMNSIFTINTAIMDNMECSIIKAHAPVIDQKVGVRSITLYHSSSFTAISNNLGNIPSKK